MFPESYHIAAPQTLVTMDIATVGLPMEFRQRANQQCSGRANWTSAKQYPR